MEERFKYRLTGAVVALCLAIIFLPMLFDGAGVPDIPFEVDLPRIRSDEISDTFSGANVNQPPPSDRDGIGPTAIRVNGVNPTVGEHHVGRRDCRRLRLR